MSSRSGLFRTADDGPVVATATGRTRRATARRRREVHRSPARTVPAPTPGPPLVRAPDDAGPAPRRVPRLVRHRSTSVDISRDRPAATTPSPSAQRAEGWASAPGPPPRAVHGSFEALARLTRRGTGRRLCPPTLPAISTVTPARAGREWPVSALLHAWRRRPGTTQIGGPVGQAGCPGKPGHPSKPGHPRKRDMRHQEGQPCHFSSRRSTAGR
jgi:hypothetical protein